MTAFWKLPPHLPAGDQTIEAPGSVLLPGLINAHTHLGVSPLGRGLVEDRDSRRVPFYMAIAAVTSIAYEPDFAAELHALMAAELAGLIRSGVTTVVSTNAAEVGWLLGALDAAGIRAYAGPIVPSVPQARGITDDTGQAVRLAATAEQLRADIATARALHQQYDQGPAGRLRVLVGPASAETCPDPFLVELADLNRQWGVPLTLHLAQSDYDVAEAQRRFGGSSARHLHDLGILGPNLIAAHGSLLSEDDLALLRQAGASIAHCASRKAKEGVFSPFQRYVEQGVRVVLATDAFTTDFIEEVRWAAVLGKLAFGSTARPTAASTLAAATLEAAAALGRADLGRIAPGLKADLTLVDLTNLFVAPVRDPNRLACLLRLRPRGEPRLGRRPAAGTRRAPSPRWTARQWPTVLAVLPSASGTSPAGGGRLQFEHR
ncbi:MAG: ethylammeline chlorohydrolase [Dehalococcoidia bacterium]|nr:MAG: ethylammeline chlorohydrolase [Dehalococcoidia bacterium]